LKKKNNEISKLESKIKEYESIIKNSTDTFYIGWYQNLIDDLKVEIFDLKEKTR
jgi:hypothetical protein